MSKQQKPSVPATKDGNNISSKLLGANLSDINIEKFRDISQYQKDKYHLSGKLSIGILKTISNKFSPEVIFTINLSNQSISSIECLSECTNLMVINMSRNNIEDLSPLKMVKTLKIVNFNENNIKILDGLASSQQLANLHLEGNMIKSIDNLICLKNCQQLKNLYLQTLSGLNQNPICGLKNYRENVFETLDSLKRLDGVQKNIEFNNGSQIKIGSKKQLKIQLKSIGPFYTNKFPSTGQYQAPTFTGQTSLKQSLSNCKTDIQNLQLRVRAMLTQ